MSTLYVADMVPHSIVHGTLLSLQLLLHLSELSFCHAPFPC
jgi:hypothetical protein